MPANENFEPDELSRFEEHLRKFRPVAPSELKLPDHRQTRWPLAAAAIVLMVMALAFLRYRPQPAQVTLYKPAQFSATENRPLTAAKLQTALLAGDDEFNRLLDESSPGILPHGQSGTVLYELGKE